MTRRPQKPAVAQRATSSPSSIRPPLLLHFRTYTTPPQIHTNPIRRSPYSTPHHRNTTAYSSHQPHTQHIPHNGPSKGVPRDAARVRQGRPPVHHQVQQAYVFTLSLLAKKPRKGKTRGAFIRWAQRPLISRQIATNRICSSLSPTKHAHTHCMQNMNTYKPTNMLLLSQPTSASSSASPRPLAWAS